jgi:hypothetical protein
MIAQQQANGQPRKMVGGNVVEAAQRSDHDQTRDKIGRARCDSGGDTTADRFADNENRQRVFLF